MGVWECGCVGVGVGVWGCGSVGVGVGGEMLAYLTVIYS